MLTICTVKTEYMKNLRCTKDEIVFTSHKNEILFFYDYIFVAT